MILEPGFSVSARITPFMETGFGFYGFDAGSGEEPNAFGMALGRWGPTWQEGGYHFIIGSKTYYKLESPHWRGGPDGRYQFIDRGSIARVNGNGWFFIPLAGVGDPLTEDMTVLPRWYALPDSEIQLLLGYIGIRFGLAPAQLVDFALGFFGVDLLHDSIREDAESPSDLDPG